MTTLLERLTDLQVKYQIAVSEISSISVCDNPDCDVHNTPNCCPNQTIQEIPTLLNCSASKAVQECPPLPKTTAVKRKEKEDGFSSPPTHTTNLEITFPNTPTRYGYNSSNTLDFALIINFNFPYNIESISELSSDHNLVMLSFTLTSTIHKHNPRAITTCWYAFSSNLKNQIHLSDFSKINSPQSLEEKLTKFTDAVMSAHNSSSKPITNKRHSYTPQHIKDLIARKNRARKLSNAR
ncbi:putative RNA-directed DNA polymerase from transposon X-element [Trichonephila clavipes]|nr:putative RNA-directed DNA polymerase from transposon X-element [Trichonephila clavipes]